MNIDAMKRLVRASRNAFDVSESLSSEKLFEIYGDLMDSIYIICGEQTNEITESLTFKLIQNRKLTDEQAAEMLLASMA